MGKFTFDDCEININGNLVKSTGNNDITFKDSRVNQTNGDTFDVCDQTDLNVQKTKFDIKDGTFLKIDRHTSNSLGLPEDFDLEKLNHLIENARKIPKDERKSFIMSNLPQVDNMVSIANNISQLLQNLPF